MTIRTGLGLSDGGHPSPTRAHPYNAAMNDVVIIGGGVIGLTAAYFALQRGLKVVVLDRNAPESDSCSTGNAGMVVPSHFVPLAAPGMIGMGLRSMLNPESPFYIRPRLDGELIDWCWRFFRAATREKAGAGAPALAAAQLESRALYVEMAERDGLDFGLQKRGLVMICATEEALHDETGLKPAADRLGVPLEVLDAAGVRALNPGLDIACVGGAYFPLDCYLSPPRLLSALRGAILRLGGEIRHEVEVVGWDAAGGAARSVRTPSGNVSGGQFVLAAGSWSPRTAAGLDVRLPMQAGKGYSFTLERPVAQLGVSAILVEARVAVTPMGDRLRFGGTMEITGLDTSVSARRLAGIVKSVVRYFPQFHPDHFAAEPAWRGLRPCSPDGLPYIGRFAAHDNVIAATGHSMLGVSMAPITARLVAEALTGGALPAWATAFSPDRYR